MKASLRKRPRAIRRNLARFTPMPAIAGAGLGTWILAAHTPAPITLTWPIVAIAAVPTVAAIIGYQLHTSDRLLAGLVKSSTRTVLSMAIA